MTKPPRTAREMVQLAAGLCAELFNRDGVLQPLWHVMRKNGEHGVVGCTFEDDTDKDAVARAMRKLFEEMDVVAYVFACESWIVRGGKELDLEAIKREGIREHPQRRECLSYTAEDAEGSVTAHQLIERPPGAQPRLEPLEWMPEADWIEGRFATMLPNKHKLVH